MLVIAVVAVSAMKGLGLAAKSSLMQNDRWRGTALARQLLDEIRQTSYADPSGTGTFGPESGETRSTYDDVDDYNGISENPPTDRSGAAIAGYTGWKRTVVVAYVSPTAVSGSTVGSDQGIKRITVTVTSPRGVITTLVALRSAYSGYEHTQIPQVTYVSSAGISLQVGTDTTTSSKASADTSNQVP